MSARLDRIYLPPILESRPRVARYIATTSDHHAYLLWLELVGLATLPQAVPSILQSSQLCSVRESAPYSRVRPRSCLWQSTCTRGAFWFSPESGLLPCL